MVEILTRFLGTEILADRLRAGEEILFVSDLHLRPDEGDKIRAFRTLLERRPAGSRVFILGDLFDYWVGPAQGRAEGWRELLDLLRNECARGLSILVLHGNRDFQLGKAFEKKTGARVWRGGLHLQRPGNLPLLCLHGDELCLDDHRYQKAKVHLRSMPLRFLLRSLPFFLSRKLADTARKQSRRVLQNSQDKNLLPTTEAFSALSKHPSLFPCDLLFGHIHRASHGTLPGAGGEARFFVLPAFEAGEEGHALLRGKELVLILHGKEDPSFGTRFPCS